MPLARFHLALQDYLQTLDKTARAKVEPYLERFGGGELSSNVGRSLSKSTQAFLQKHVDDSIWRRLVARSFARDRDRLEAVKRVHAGAWLSGFP